jgi:hypothetical protein
LLAALPVVVFFWTVFLTVFLTAVLTGAFFLTAALISAEADTPSSKHKATSAQKRRFIRAPQSTAIELRLYGGETDRA